jgi:PTH1 family peptidyl-tRNA hydrolase
MHYLIVGLGNIGPEYQHTKHNIGFDIVDNLAQDAGVRFTNKRYGAIADLSVKNKHLTLLKPSTYMNLSGLAVRYWMQAENIPLENLLVVVDDLSLPFGKLRLSPGGSDGGHNGLKHIQQTLNTDRFARLRFGIGNDYLKGHQIDYVLSGWSAEQLKTLPDHIN